VFTYRLPRPEVRAPGHVLLVGLWGAFYGVPTFRAKRRTTSLHARLSRDCQYRGRLYNPVSTYLTGKNAIALSKKVRRSAFVDPVAMNKRALAFNFNLSYNVNNSHSYGTYGHTSYTLCKRASGYSYRRHAPWHCCHLPSVMGGLQTHCCLSLSLEEPGVASERPGHGRWTMGREWRPPTLGRCAHRPRRYADASPASSRPTRSQ
jgi:hypothetical protein